VRRAVLIHNPAAGIHRWRDAVEEIRAILTSGGIEMTVAPTEGPEHATQIAREVERGDTADTVLVFGGDGTLREAARGLLGSEVALAPLSGGTTNVVTRSLGLPVEPRRAARMLLDSTPVACDVGLCNHEPFLILASLGLDAAIMASVTSRFKNLAGRGAVVTGGLGVLLRYRFPEIAWQAGAESGRSTFVAACNIAEYGGDFRLAPDASFFNHRLSLVTFDGRGKLAIMAFALNLILGRHLAMRGVSSRPLRELRIPGPVEAPLELDGDHLVLEPPLVMRLSEKRIRLLFPRHAAPRQRRPTSPS
jgi:diacylglycerol kinase family enzyme